MKKLWFLLIPLSFVLVSCTGEVPSGKLTQLQEQIDQIAKKLEGGEGLQAKGETTDIEDVIKDLNNDIDKLQKKVDELSKKIADLDSRYTSHLKKFHR